jgi:hypothetical protein
MKDWMKERTEFSKRFQANKKDNMKSEWTIQDEAIHRGANYAEKHAKANLDLARYKEATVFAILKNAYQEGFLHGFEHKFDDHNYERQTDTVSECPTEEKKDG